MLCSETTTDLLSLRSMSSFDVADVDRRARAEAKPDDSRQVYVQDIFDWTDSYNENLAGSSDSAEAKLALDRIAELWISYAQYEISLKQWKKAVQVYDDALQDELVAKQAKVYVSYAEFCKSRNKQSNAVKVYIKGLKADLSDEHCDQIWIKFGAFMNSTSPQKLSFEDLYSAISQQVDVTLKKPSSLAIDIIEGRAPEPVKAASPPSPPPPNKSPPPFPMAPALRSDPAPQPPLPPEPRPPIAAALGEQQVTVENGMNNLSKGSSLPDVDLELANWGDMSGFKYPEDCKLYKHRPPSLFSSPDMEPMISGLDALSAEELDVLEKFLGVTTIDPYEEKDKDSVYERVLDILEGMWYAQALKERHFDIWFAELIRKHTLEENDLQKTFGRGERHKLELDNLRRKNSLQIELLNVIINKTLLSVLKEQQTILHSIDFPYVEHPITVSSLVELEGPKLSAEMDQIIKQKRIIAAALSLRLKPKSAIVNGQIKMPTSDGKKRKKTRRKLSVGDVAGGDTITGSLENSPLGNADTASSGDPPLKRIRTDTEPVSNASPTVKTEATSAAAKVNPASLPLLMQLAKMLKNKKTAAASDSASTAGDNPAAKKE